MSRQGARTVAYTVRYSEREAAEIQAAAERCALEVGSYVRMTSLRTTRERPFDRFDPLAIVTPAAPLYPLKKKGAR